MIKDKIKITKEQEKKLFFVAGFFAGQDSAPTNLPTERATIDESYNRNAEIILQDYKVTIDETS